MQISIKKYSWQDKDGLTYIVVKAKPNAKITKIDGEIDLPSNSSIPVNKALCVSLAAQPEDNKANKELIKLLSKTLNIKKNKISISSGLSSKLKIVVISDHIIL